MLPDISGYQLHKIIEDVDFNGVPVPGLRGEFFRRAAEGGRTESVGVYTYGGDELFTAWGYAGEPHCRYAAVRRPDGTWSAPRRGCPEVQVLAEGDEVTALAVSLADGERVVRQPALSYTATVNARSVQLCASL